jgi:hypothetical protein
MPLSTLAPDGGDTVTAHDVPTSFGVFKPVGYVMVGVPSKAQADSVAAALHASAWPDGTVLHFAPTNGVSELEGLVDSAGPLAGFGYEITLLRRYLALAKEGYRWLLVKVDGTEQAAKAAVLARAGGATLAVHYRTLVVEDLI